MYLDNLKYEKQQSANLTVLVAHVSYMHLKNIPSIENHCLFIPFFIFVSHVESILHPGFYFCPHLPSHLPSLLFLSHPVVSQPCGPGLPCSSIPLFSSSSLSSHLLPFVADPHLRRLHPLSGLGVPRLEEQREAARPPCGWLIIVIHTL